LSESSNTERRRSERASLALPVVVRGVDLLGQPFEERTATLAFNLHGCRYSSKHPLPNNSWITLEIGQGPERHNVRARVAWLERPRSVREFFQIAVELESPANIWGLDSPPGDWAIPERSLESSSKFPAEPGRQHPGQSESGADRATLLTLIERFAGPLKNESSASARAAAESMTETGSPLLRELSAELERQARQAVETATTEAIEQIRRTVEEVEQKRSERAKDELKQAQTEARENFSAELARRQEEAFGRLQSEFEGGCGQARELMGELDRKAQILRAERRATPERASRIDQGRLEPEAETDRPLHGPSNGDSAATESAAASWRQRLESEMGLAQARWNELLQSSLDSTRQSLVAQLSESSNEVLRGAEQKISERTSEIRQPLAQMFTEAQDTLNGVKSAFAQEVTRARSSLSEIEHSASRIKEYSAQLEAASLDALNQLHGRLENILKAQTEEMSRRAESLMAGMPQRFTAAVNSLAREWVEQATAEFESKFAPHLARVPELLGELSSEQSHIEEGLRLHREQLRQVSENSQREVASRLAATVSGLQSDFELARKDAMAKWTEQVDAIGVRASQATAESIGQASEWLQQEARARLQVHAEQALATAGIGFEDKTAVATRNFALQLERQSTAALAQVQQNLDGAASEFDLQARTQLEKTAEAEAASFAQILRGISEQEIHRFTSASRSILEDRTQDLARVRQEFVANLEAIAGRCLERFREQTASQLEQSAAEGRSILAAEYSSMLNRYGDERDLREKEWIDNLELLSNEAAAKYQERLRTSSDSSMLASVRRLNEYGQNVLESLMRSADQALRDSCSKVFEGFAAGLRERTTGPAVTNFTPEPGPETSDTPGLEKQAAAYRANG
jgi:hypothetical protein